MRKIFARACLWFFVSFIFVNVHANSTLSEMTLWGRALTTVIAAFVISGLAFCVMWYEYEKKEEEKIKN